MNTLDAVQFEHKSLPMQFGDYSITREVEVTEECFVYAATDAEDNEVRLELLHACFFNDPEIVMPWRQEKEQQGAEVQLIKGWEVAVFKSATE